MSEGQQADERAYAVYCEGRLLYERSDWCGACRLFKRSAKMSPHFKTFELWGECLLELGQPAEAILPLAAAVALNRGPRAPLLLAKAWRAIGEFKMADEWLGKSIERQPNYGPAIRLSEEWAG